MTLPLLLLIGAVSLILAVMFAMYRRLVQLRSRAYSAWDRASHAIDQRISVVPALIEVIEQHVDDEQYALQQAQRAYVTTRDQLITGPHPQLCTAISVVNGTLRQLLALGIMYPELGQDPQFQALHEQLKVSEAAVEQHCDEYNQLVEVYNGKRAQRLWRRVAGLGHCFACNRLDLDAVQQSVEPTIAFS